MVALDNNEAILFRLLTSFFGRDRVIPQMSLLAVCGGELPAVQPYSPEAEKWARKSKCLFTVVNEEDLPRLVVELGVGNSTSIDLEELEKQSRLKEILKAAEIPYILVSRGDFHFITDPESPENWFHYLKSKFEDNHSSIE